MKKTLRLKLVSIFLLISLIPVLMLSLFSYGIAKSSAVSNAEMSINDSTKQIAIATQNSLENIENIMDYIFMDKRIQEIISDEIGLANGNLYKELNSLINGYFVNSNFLASCSIITERGQRYYYRQNVTDKELEQRLYDSAVAADGKIIWHDYVDTDAFSPLVEDVIIASRSLKNLKNKDVINPIGVITVYLSSKLFDELYNENNDYEEFLFLTADMSLIKAGKNNESLIQAVKTGTLSSESDVVTLSHTKYIGSMLPIMDNSMQVVTLKPYQDVWNAFNPMMILIICTALFNVIAILFLSLYSSRKIAEPLVSLNNEMEKVSNGNFEVLEFTNTSPDEVGQAQHHFNIMVKRIKDLMNDTVQKEKEKQLEELKALQYQINPHFLYNTLNSVRLTAMINRSDNIVQMLDALIRMLRNASGKIGSLIPLKDEISTIEDFVYIHQIRYQGNIKLVNCINSEISDYLVPNFILQPIVENALFHGLEAADKKGSIILRGEVVDNKLLLYIEDTGNGMTQKEIEAALSKSNTDSGFIKIGIRNIDDRIKILFGGDFGLTITSLPGYGTKVTIAIPLLNNQ